MSDLDAARAELRDAERLAHMLDLDDDRLPPVPLTRLRIERNLAWRRVEAWRHLVTRMESGQ